MPNHASRPSRLLLPTLGAAALGIVSAAVGVLLPLADLRAQTPAGVNPALKFYTHGDPSADEQYLLELVNHARANPAAEGQMLAGVTDPTLLDCYTHFGVNVDQLRGDFAGYQAQPPLAFNASLLASSRAQSLDQAAHGFQGHNGSDGSTFDGRITAAGYAWSAVGENVYAYVANPFYGFVGMITDWGVSDIEHRVNIMNTDASRPVFKETGISCVQSSLTNFGPLVITEDFATPTAADTALLAGVVYNDADANGFYTQGEGLAGIIITSPQSSFYTITSASGGYALPLDQINGGSTVTITFDDGHGHHLSRQAPCGNNVADNVKADLVINVSNGAFNALSVRPVKDASRVTLQKGKVLIVRDGADASQALTVHYEVSGTAVAGQDYKPLQGWATIPAGSASVVVKIRPMADPAADDQAGGGQTLTITLGDVDQDPLMALGSGQASLLIE